MIRRTLLAGAALLAMAAGAGAQDAPPEAATDPVATERTQFNALATLPPAATEAFLGRPLFSPSRRPRPVAEPDPFPEPTPEPIDEPDPPAEPAEPPTMQLAGTLEMPDGIVALMRDPGTNQTLLVHVGDDVEGWTVSTITATAITLELDGAVLDLGLFEPSPAGADAGGEPAGAGALDPFAEGEGSNVDVLEQPEEQPIGGGSAPGLSGFSESGAVRRGPFPARPGREDHHRSNHIPPRTRG